MTDPSIVAFVGLAAVLTVSPGPDMALVTRNALAFGRRAAFATSCGIVSGVLVWAVASALGVAALLAASAEAYAALQLAGAAYLVFLGVRALWGAATMAPGHPDGSARRARMTGLYVQGLATNLLNPKVGVFYVALLPQFIAPSDPILAKALLLGGIHSGLGVLWLGAFAWFITSLGPVMNRRRVRQGLASVTGGVLILLGIRVALERR